MNNYSRIIADTLKKINYIGNITQREQEIISENLHSNPQEIALKIKPDKDIRPSVIASQIKGFQALQKKVPEWKNIPNLIFPPHISMEQCSSSATASYKAQLVEGGATSARQVLTDLTGGFGVDFAFMSKKFKKSIFIEQNPDLAKLAEHNLPLLGCTNFEVKNQSAEDFLRENHDPISLIYIDPARRDTNGRRTYAVEDCSPNVLDLEQLLVNQSLRVLIKLSTMIDVKNLTKQFKNINSIHIVSFLGECKEILVFLSKDAPKIKVYTVNICKNFNQCFDFYLDDEDNAKCEYSYLAEVAPPKKYLYEPNSSIMKSGGFKSLAQHYNLWKLQINSHLYTSDNLINDFPGRKFEIINYEPFTKKISFLKDIKSANISVRNFPLTAENLRKKLKLHDGGEDYIFGTTNHSNQLILLHCRKIF